MTPVFRGYLTFFVLLVALALVLLAVRVIQPAWFRSRIGRGLLAVGFGGTLLGMVIWQAGRLAGALAVTRVGAGATYVGLLMLLPAALVMPFAAAADRAGMFLLKRRTTPAPPAPADDRLLSRRSVLRLGTAALPAAAAATGASGFLQARQGPTLPVVRFDYPDLHPDLEGFRILQLSDLHLGACLGLADLERALDEAKRRAKPDLVVITGDLADDPTLIPEALRMVANMGARYGVLSCLGNHEYLHDIDVTRPFFDESPVPLLVGDGRTMDVGRAKLFVGGCDDPVYMRGAIAQLVGESIAEAAAKAPVDTDFRLLLCHRPEGFGPATEHGFDLTLSGHTHGGQLGLFGRSLFEHIRPNVGWWGTYAKRRSASGQGRPGGLSRLYTTSGFGHWFPFRVGCPTEMPLIVLGRGERDGSRNADRV
jgi:predicted MPP superfamily phosphohydrolase